MKISYKHLTKCISFKKHSDLIKEKNISTAKKRLNNTRYILEEHLFTSMAL